MENKNTSVLKPERAPFLAGLADACGVAADYRDGGVHPSLPNYILATSGDTQAISDDEGPAAHPLTVDNLFRQVRATGRTAVSYAEGATSPCQLRSAGRYAVKHVPALYYTGADDRVACATDVVRFDELEPALDENRLAAFVSITPDLCHDMHDCAVGVGDDWLRLVVTAITGSRTYAAGRTALFVVWDESAGGGSMPFVAVAPSVAPGTVVTTPLGHTSLLAFTEDALGISTHLGAASAAPALAAGFGL
jgi:hypothetical protein